MHSQSDSMQTNGDKRQTYYFADLTTDDEKGINFTKNKHVTKCQENTDQTTCLFCNIKISLYNTVEI